MGKVLLVVILHLLSDVTLCCPGNWTRYSRRKVCFRVFEKPRLPWKYVRGFCADQFADFAKLEDFTDQNFINTSLIQDTSISGVWLGARHTWFSRDTWRWADKSEMNIDDFMWLEGNPDNGGGTILEDSEDCLMMRTDGESRGLLNDFNCRKRLPFVCETSEGYTELTTIQLPSLDEAEPEINMVQLLVPISAFLVIAPTSVVLVLLVLRRKRALAQNYENMQGMPQSGPEHVYDSLARGGGATTMSCNENTNTHCKANSFGQTKFPGVKTIAFQHENGATKQPTHLEDHNYVNTKATVKPIDQLENSGYFAVKVSEGRCAKPSNLARMKNQMRAASANDDSDRQRPNSGYADVEATVAKDTVKAVADNEYITPVHSENLATDCYLTPISSDPPNGARNTDFSAAIYDEVL